MQQLMSGSEASAAGALHAEKRPEQARRIETSRRGVEEKEKKNSCERENEDGDPRPADAGARWPAAVGPLATPARAL